MPITLTFPTLNVSIQPTDIVYTCLIRDGQAGINHPSANVDTKPIDIGVVTVVNHVTGVVSIDDTGFTYPTLTSSHYFFFSKDKTVNTSGILGYYALVEYRNHSKKQVEIFATSTEFSISSK